MGIRTFQFGVENSDLSGDPKNLNRVPTWLITGNHINPLGMDVWTLDLNDSQGYIRDK